MRGYSLLDLLLTMSVAAILLAAAAPGFEYSISQSRLDSQIDQLAMSLQFARSEAVKRNAHVSVCKSADGASCAASGDWEQGWIVFVNADNDVPAEADSGEEVLRVVPELMHGYSLRSSRHTLEHHVTWRPIGVSAAIGRFVLCEKDRLERARVAFINRVGRIRMGADSDGNGIPEESDGTDIASCAP